MKLVWAEMVTRDHYTKYDADMNYDIPWMKEEVLEKGGLFLHTKEMHKWVV